MRRLAAAVIVALAPLLSGCITLFRGTTQPVSFFSDPPGATIVVSGGENKPAAATGVTPCTLVLSRGHGALKFTTSFPGSAPFDGKLESKNNVGSTVFLCCEPLLTIIGTCVDLATAAYKDWPHEVHVSSSETRLVWELPKKPKELADSEPYQP